MSHSAITEWSLNVYLCVTLSHTHFSLISMVGPLLNRAEKGTNNLNSGLSLKYIQLHGQTQAYMNTSTHTITVRGDRFYYFQSETLRQK